MVYTGMKVCLCTLHSKVRIKYLWLTRFLNGRTEMSYEMRILVVDIMGYTKKMQA